MAKDNSEYLKKFNVDGWYGALIGLSDDYYHLEQYIKNKRVRQTYLDSIRIINIDLTNEVTKNEDSPSVSFSEDEFDKLPHLESVDFAFKQHSNQILVVLVSYLEQIIQEFLEVFYYYKPNEMKQIYGYVDLSLLLNIKSNVELLNKLSKVAAEAIKGGMVSKIKRIEVMTGKQFDKNLINRINALVRKRNDIIHKIKNYNVNGSTIEKNADSIIELLRQLGLIMNSKKNPVTNNSGLLGNAAKDNN